nr:Golgi-associated plant pathogenesis-related protein 1-like [Rhipicephalus microplus]
MRIERDPGTEAGDPMEAGCTAAVQYKYCEQVARYWYSEIKYYDFLLDPSILHVQAGHFSQMVWRSSTTFGVGKARTRSGKIIVVAMYKPAGNVLGEFHRNVLPQPHTDEDEGSVSPQLSDVAAAASAVVAAAASPSSSRSSP